ncbi:unnamed protein product [Caenorhabditis angaria]|uniref:Uncharacterized protein n=1 Tax=Caenorhabditis angaria TaxID=860376 RepID=A0A9P1I732_9PELO|nr:unnamed protein product [Caenorhabditis angaria]
MKYIAVGQNDGVIELFETATLKPIHKYEVHSMKVRKIAFLPGDERFLSGCDDKLIKLNSLTDLGQSETNRTNRALRIYAAHSGPIYGLEIDEKSGGTRFASSSSAQIFLWHIEISTPISVIPTEHSGLITGLSFSPTSRHLLSAGENALICCYRIPASGEESPIPEEEEIQEPESQAQEENMEIPPAEHLEQNEYPLEYQQYAAENYAENQQAAQYEQQLYQHQELPQEYPQEPAENVHEFQPHTIKTEPEASYSPPPQFSQHPQKQEYDA